MIRLELCCVTNRFDTKWDLFWRTPDMPSMWSSNACPMGAGSNHWHTKPTEEETCVRLLWSSCMFKSPNVRDERCMLTSPDVRHERCMLASPEENYVKGHVGRLAVFCTFQPFNRHARKPECNKKLYIKKGSIMPSQPRQLNTRTSHVRNQSISINVLFYVCSHRGDIRPLRSIYYYIILTYPQDYEQSCTQAVF